MSSVNNKISLLTSTQLPEFVQEDYPTFVRFLEAYYEFLETKLNDSKGAYLKNDVYTRSKELASITDVDQSLTEFEEQFFNTFLQLFPRDTDASKSLLIKNAISLYLSKGNERSFKYFFRALFNEEVNIAIPRNDILVASGGKWKILRVIRITPNVYSLSTKGGTQFSLIVESFPSNLKVYVTKRPIEKIEIIDGKSGSGFTSGGNVLITDGGSNTAASFTYTSDESGQINGINKVNGGLYEFTPNVAITGGTTSPTLKITMGDEVEVLQTVNVDYFVQKEYKKITFNKTKQSGVKVKIAYDNFDFSILKSKKIEGLTTGSTAILESSTSYKKDGFKIVEFEINQKTILGEFLNGENFKIDIITDSEETVNLFVFPFAGLRKINIIDGGSNYKVNDPVKLIGGSFTQEGKAFVSKVFSGFLTKILVEKGGSGFVSGSPIKALNLLNGKVDAAVVTVDLAAKNTQKTFDYSTDVVHELRNSAINTANYKTSNVFISSNILSPNANTMLRDVFLYDTFEDLGPIQTVYVFSSTAPAESSPTLKTQAANTEIFTGSIKAPVAVDYYGSLGKLKIITKGSSYKVGDKVRFINPIGCYGLGAAAAVTEIDNSGGIENIQFQPSPPIHGKYNDVSITSGSNLITGANTNFTSHFEVGSKVIIFNETRTVQSITSDTSMTVTVPFTTTKSNTEIGLYGEFSIGGEGYFDDAVLPLCFVESAFGVGAKVEVESILGKNDVLRMASEKRSGEIEEITIEDYGAGYKVEPIINLTESGDGNALAEAEIQKSYFEYEGVYTNTDGHISGDKKIQNSTFYNTGSYILRTKQQFIKFKQAFLSLLHPSGSLAYCYHTPEVSFISTRNRAFIETNKLDTITLGFTDVIRFNSGVPKNPERELEYSGGGDFLWQTPKMPLSAQKFYFSFWVRFPPRDSVNNKRAAGFVFGDVWKKSVYSKSTVAPDGSTVYASLGPTFAFRSFFDEAETNLWNLQFDLLLTDSKSGGIYSTQEKYINSRKSYQLPANDKPLWKHILIEFDSTEEVRKNRFKLYINDTKVEHTELDNVNDRYHYLRISSIQEMQNIGSERTSYQDAIIGQFPYNNSGHLTVTDLSSFNVKQNLQVTSQTFPFDIFDSPEKIVSSPALTEVAGIWFKMVPIRSATQITNYVAPTLPLTAPDSQYNVDYFDFDNINDRRYFISTDLEYVNHTNIKKGVMADVWGTGTSKYWAYRNYLNFTSDWLSKIAAAAPKMQKFSGFKQVFNSVDLAHQQTVVTVDEYLPGEIEITKLTVNSDGAILQDVDLITGVDYVEVPPNQIVLSSPAITQFVSNTIIDINNSSDTSAGYVDGFLSITSPDKIYKQANISYFVNDSGNVTSYLINNPGSFETTNVNLSILDSNTRVRGINVVTRGIGFESGFVTFTSDGEIYENANASYTVFSNGAIDQITVTKRGLYASKNVFAYINSNGIYVKNIILNNSGRYYLPSFVTFKIPFDDTGINLNSTNVRVISSTYNPTSYKIDSRDHLYGWGEGDEFLGEKNQTYVFPVLVGKHVSDYWKEISLGESHFAAISKQGHLFTWGNNDKGQLGLGDKNYRSYPVQVGSSTWKKVTTSQASTAAINEAGELYTWGDNTYGTLGINDHTITDNSSPTKIGTQTWKDVAAVGFGTIGAINSSGYLFTWGYNNNGELGSGTLIEVRSAPTQIDSSNTYSKISGAFGTAGGFFGALTSSGKLMTWGGNLYGNLGLNDTDDKSYPTMVNSDTWIKISCGSDRMAAINSANILYTWGLNSNGQLGLGNSGSANNRSYPTQLDSNTWFDISAGFESMLAVRTNGDIYTWGKQTSGNFGNGTGNTQLGNYVSQSNYPIKIDSILKGLVKTNQANSSYTAINAGLRRISGFGYELRGPVSADKIYATIDDTNTRIFSASVVGPKMHYQNGFITIVSSSGRVFENANIQYTVNATNEVIRTTVRTRGIYEANSLRAFINSDPYIRISNVSINKSGTGYLDKQYLTINNYYNANLSNAEIQTLVSEKTTITGFSGTAYKIQTDGTLFSWGDGTYGRQGLNDLIRRSSPTQIGTDKWKKIASSGLHVLAINAQGYLYSWGLNDYGVLGLGTFSGEVKLAPTKVNSDSNDWIDVVAGPFNSAAINSTNHLFTWGSVNDGLLGSDDLEYYFTDVNRTEIDYVRSKTDPENNVSAFTVPTYSGIANVRTLKITENIVYAVTTSNQAIAWGKNVNGRFGINNNDNKIYYNPTPIANGIGVLDIDSSTYGEHAALLSNTGNVYTWGVNFDGQLGLGDRIRRSSPVLVSSLSGINSISISEVRSYALNSSGVLFSWGLNNIGQLGIGDTESRSLPTQVLSPLYWKQFFGAPRTCYGITPEGDYYSWGANELGQFGLNSIVPVSSNTPLFINSLIPQENWSYNVSSGSWNKKISLIPPFKAFIKYSTDSNGNIISTGIEDTGLFLSNSIIEIDSQKAKGDIDLGVFAYSNVYTSGFSSAIITSNNKLLMVGNNRSYQLGLSDIRNRSVYTQVNDDNWKFVSVGKFHTAAINAAGFVYTWGRNSDGQLGVGDFTQRTTPTIVSGHHKARMVCALDAATVILTEGTSTGGDILVAGRNLFGELGRNINDPLVKSNTFVNVSSNFISTEGPFPNTIVKIAGCGSTAGAVSRTGILYMWGKTRAVIPQTTAYYYLIQPNIMIGGEYTGTPINSDIVRYPYPVNIEKNFTTSEIKFNNQLINVRNELIVIPGGSGTFENYTNKVFSVFYKDIDIGEEHCAAVADVSLLNFSFASPSPTYLTSDFSSYGQYVNYYFSGSLFGGGFATDTLENTPLVWGLGTSCQTGRLDVIDSQRAVIPDRLLGVGQEILTSVLYVKEPKVANKATFFKGQKIDSSDRSSELDDQIYSFGSSDFFVLGRTIPVGEYGPENFPNIGGAGTIKRPTNNHTIYGRPILNNVSSYSAASNTAAAIRYPQLITDEGNDLYLQRHIGDVNFWGVNKDFNFGLARYRSKESINPLAVLKYENRKIDDFVFNTPSRVYEIKLIKSSSNTQLFSKTSGVVKFVGGGINVPATAIYTTDGQKVNSIIIRSNGLYELSNVVAKINDITPNTNVVIEKVTFGNTGFGYSNVKVDFVAYSATNQIVEPISTANVYLITNSMGSIVNTAIYGEGLYPNTVSYIIPKLDNVNSSIGKIEIVKPGTGYPSSDYVRISFVTTDSNTPVSAQGIYTTTSQQITGITLSNLGKYFFKQNNSEFSITATVLHPTGNSNIVSVVPVKRGRGFANGFLEIVSDPNATVYTKPNVSFTVNSTGAIQSCVVNQPGNFSDYYEIEGQFFDNNVRFEITDSNTRVNSVSVINGTGLSFASNYQLVFYPMIGYSKVNQIATANFETNPIGDVGGINLVSKGSYQNPVKRSVGFNDNNSNRMIGAYINGINCKVYNVEVFSQNIPLTSGQLTFVSPNTVYQTAIATYTVNGTGNISSISVTNAGLYETGNIRAYVRDIFNNPDYAAAELSVFVATDTQNETRFVVDTLTPEYEDVFDIYGNHTLDSVPSFDVTETTAKLKVTVNTPGYNQNDPANTYFAGNANVQIGPAVSPGEVKLITVIRTEDGNANLSLSTGNAIVQLSVGTASLANLTVELGNSSLTTINLTANGLNITPIFEQINSEQTQTLFIRSRNFVDGNGPLTIVGGGLSNTAINLGLEVSVNATGDIVSITRKNSAPAIYNQSNGGIYAVGTNYGSILKTIPNEINTKTVFASSNNSAVITNDGTLYVWGRNNLGQLGLNDIKSRSAPVKLGSSSWSTIAFSNQTAAAIRNDGKLFTWGSSQHGQLGSGIIGENAKRSSPVMISDSNWKYISLSDDSMAAINAGNNLFTWGLNDYGQLGTNDTQTKSEPVMVNSSSWANVAVGNGFMAAINSTGYLFTWGKNDDGQLGTNNLTSRSSPALIYSSGAQMIWKTVAVGNKFMAAINSNGYLWVWGDNSMGQLGTNDTVSVSSPTLVGRVPDGNSWSTITIGQETVAAISNTGALYVWGNNDLGELGLDDYISRSSPTLVSNSWSQISVGFNHMIAFNVSGNNSVYTWGSNEYGKLGYKGALNEVKKTPYPLLSRLTYFYANSYLYEPVKVKFPDGQVIPLLSEFENGIYDDETHRFVYPFAYSANDSSNSTLTTVSGIGNTSYYTVTTWQGDYTVDDANVRAPIVTG